MVSVWPVMLMWFGTWFTKPASSARIVCVYGFSTVPPRSNIGRFCWSTIWMRRPSGVRSSSNWSLNGSSAWLLPMASCSACISVSRRCFSCAFCCSSEGCGFSPGDFSNGMSLAPFGRSIVPPSLIIDVLAPPGPLGPGAGEKLLPLSGLGLRKYSEIAARSLLVVAPTSHITMKNAIIAVTKSA